MKEKSFNDHLIELKGGLFVWLTFFITITTLGFWKSDYLVNLVVKPLNEPLIYTSPTGGFFFTFQISLFFGLLVTIPILVYQILKFVKPALSNQVRLPVIKIFLFSYLLVITSIIFTYFFAVPGAINFLESFESDSIKALFVANEYLSFVSAYLIGMAILFQLPVIILTINYFAPIKIKILMKFQRLVIAVSFIVAAVLTPTPDPVNQTMMALPVILLYELSIILVHLKNKKSELKFGKHQIIICILIILLMLLVLVYKKSPFSRHKDTVNILGINQQEILEPKATLTKESLTKELTSEYIRKIQFEVSDFTVIDGDLIIVKKNSGEIYKSTLDHNGRDFEQIFKTPDSSIIECLYHDNVSKKAYVVTDTSRIFTFLPLFEEVIFSKNSDEFKIKSISFYDNNLYVLEETAYVVWKYPSSDGSIFNAKIEYIKSNKIINNLAINGFIYFLTEDGEINKYLSGKQQLFNFSSNNQVKRILSNANLDFISIIGNDEISLVDNGAKELLRLKFKNIEKEDMLYLSNDNKIALVLKNQLLYIFNLD